MKKEKPTPLSRAQKRLQFWRDQLASRQKPLRYTNVGSVGVSIQEDEKLEQELIKSAEAAVKDWEDVVIAVASYKKLVEENKNLKEINLRYFKREKAREAV